MMKTWAMMAAGVVLAMALAGAAGIVWAGVQVGRTSLLDTFKKMPTKTMIVGDEDKDRVVRVPAYWEYDGEHRAAVDPYLDLRFPTQGETWDPEQRRVRDWIANSEQSP